MIRTIKKEDVLRLYNEGLNDSEISRILGCNSVTIHNFRKELGLKSIFKYKRKYDIDEYLRLSESGLTDVAIIDILGCSGTTISAYRKILNLKWEEFNYIPSKFEEEVLIGTLLGDGCLKTPHFKNVSGCVGHGIKQKEYCEYKYNILKNMCSSINTYTTKKIDIRTNKYYTNVIFNLKANKYLTLLYPLLYNNRIKYLNDLILDKFTEVSLAFMFMDDGFKAAHGGYYISTDCFTTEDLIKFQKILLYKFDIKSSIHKGNRIYIKKESSNTFKQLIEKYMIDSMKYKLHVS